MEAKPATNGPESLVTRFSICPNSRAMSICLIMMKPGSPALGK